MRILMTATTSLMYLKRRRSKEVSSRMICHWLYREQMTSFRIIIERLCLKTRTRKEETNNNNIKVKDIIIKIINRKIKERDNSTKQDQLRQIGTVSLEVDLRQ